MQVILNLHNMSFILFNKLLVIYLFHKFLVLRLKEKLMKFFLSNKKTMAICLLSVFFLFGCSSGTKPIQKNNDSSFKFKQYHEIPYLKNDEVFDDKKNNESHSGRYADKTTDGQIDWSNIKDEYYGLTPVVNDMLKKITLDGKNVTLPMSFAQLGGEFRDFKNGDYKDLTDDIAPITFKDSNNNTLYISKLDPYPKLPKWNVFMSLLDNENNFLIGLELNMQNNDIQGLNNSMLLSTKELKVDGIGVGNTFNEMYEKFGKPNIISSSKNGEITTVIYSDMDNKKNNYVIAFKHRTKIDNPKTKQQQDTKANVITDVSISILRDFLEKK